MGFLRDVGGGGRIMSTGGTSREVFWTSAIRHRRSVVAFQLCWKQGTPASVRWTSSNVFAFHYCSIKCALCVRKRKVRWEGEAVGVKATRATRMKIWNMKFLIWFLGFVFAALRNGNFSCLVHQGGVSGGGDNIARRGKSHCHLRIFVLVGVLWWFLCFMVHHPATGRRRLTGLHRDGTPGRIVALPAADVPWQAPIREGGVIRVQNVYMWMNEMRNSRSLVLNKKWHRSVLGGIWIHYFRIERYPATA